MKPAAVFSMLGICQRAKKLISGQENVSKACALGKVSLVILAEDTSDNTVKKVRNLCTRKGIPFFSWGYSKDLGRAIGKDQRKVIGITDSGIAKEIIKRLNLLMGVGDIDETTRI